MKPEMYPALADWFMSAHEEADEYSDTFKECFEKIIKEYQLDWEAIRDRVQATFVTRRDGTVECLGLICSGSWPQ